MRYLGILLAAAFTPALWAVKPQIYVDNVNGSALASGAPEAIGPVGAAATCHTNGVASTTIQWPANGLSGAGVPTDGSAILFLGTGAGRQFSVISGLAAGTVTVGDSFNIAAGTPVDCAVGGRRLSVTQQLATDMKTSGQDAWQIFLVNSGLTYTWSSTITISGGGTGKALVGVKDGGVRPIVICDFQPGDCLSMQNGSVKSIEFRNSNATKTGTVGIAATDNATVEDTIVGGTTAASSFAVGVDSSGSSVGKFIVGSLIRNNESGVEAGGLDFVWLIAATVFQTNNIGVEANGQNAFLLMGNIFWENDIGVELSSNVYNHYEAMIFNTFHGQTTAAVDITDAGGLHDLLFSSNLLTNNSIGVRYTGAARNIERESAQVDFNCYGIGPTANGSNISGFILGPNVINVNPMYVDTVTGDFTPTNNDVSFIAWPPGLDGITPRFFPGTTTISQPRCGAIQPGEGIGGFSNVGI